MEYTNNANYPPSVFSALTADTYDRSDMPDDHISVTTLIDSAHIRRLKLKHKDELVIDASSLGFMALGSAMHQTMEGADSTYLKEYRVERKFNGKTVSGKIDVWEHETQTLADYKVLSKVSLGYILDDLESGVACNYECQLNVLAYLLKVGPGITVKRLRLYCFVRDINQGDQFRTKRPLSNMFQNIHMPLWSTAKQLEYIEGRLADHYHGKDVCSDREQWARLKPLKVRMIGKKKATNGGADFATMEAAEAFRQEKGSRYEIFRPPTEPVRCNSYCPVSQFCSVLQTRIAGVKELPKMEQAKEVIEEAVGVKLTDVTNHHCINPADL